MLRLQRLPRGRDYPSGLMIGEERTPCGYRMPNGMYLGPESESYLTSIVPDDVCARYAMLQFLAEIKERHLKGRDKSTSI